MFPVISPISPKTRKRNLSIRKIEQELELEESPLAHAFDRLICKVCNQEKSEHDGFYKYNKSTCKQCLANKARQKRHQHFIPHMLMAAKYRAEQKGLEFTLTEADIRIPMYCPVLGVELDLEGIGTELEVGPSRTYGPSLDRFDNNKGYTPDNVNVISWRANRLKNDSTPDELRKVLAYVEGI